MHNKENITFLALLSLFFAMTRNPTWFKATFEAFRAGCRTVSNNGSGSGLAPAQNILAVQVWFGFTWAHFRGSGSVQVHSSKILLVQVRFGFIDLKFNCRYSFRPEKNQFSMLTWIEKKKEKLLILLMITTALIVRVPAPEASGYGNNILTFVRGSGSVWVHLSTILRVQVWFRFTEVKFCWFRFGSGSPKWNGSFGFTVRVQVRFDTLI